MNDDNDWPPELAVLVQAHIDRFRAAAKKALSEGSFSDGVNPPKPFVGRMGDVEFNAALTALNDVLVTAGEGAAFDAIENESRRARRAEVALREALNAAEAKVEAQREILSDVTSLKHAFPCGDECKNALCRVARNVKAQMKAAGLDPL